MAGQRALEFQVSPNSTVGEAVDLIKEKFPELSRHRLLCALNQNYISGDERLHDGDEVAIFTAVSGG